MPKDHCAKPENLTAIYQSGNEAKSDLILQKLVHVWSEAAKNTDFSTDIHVLIAICGSV